MSDLFKDLKIREYISEKEWEELKIKLLSALIPAMVKAHTDPHWYGDRLQK